MSNDSGQQPHKLTLSDRKSLSLTGVSEIISFEEDGVILKTGLGCLRVQGHGLKLKTLSPEGGQVEVNGTITALSYAEPKSRSWTRRLFG